ncbi:hypothetical protein C8J27_103279 [Rhodobacter aestuarii]|uniref:Quinohemoprotein amine dehydrogenase alpha subunit haem binding domain-containing protein n=1 Tax=Rhodobacter aestuarii TaxID=453582 RepID=A0A1N7JXB0_9RHOB|nr:hypothetical protein [Rhodobacter aestuarii]PTV95948.1 hypothetical protein C8J27_103279 [Rhodobacter aestuarii]SIS53968.1 hypothetical protein SAMN05421580_102155 [Rhodobacter aestuarii]
MLPRFAAFSALSVIWLVVSLGPATSFPLPKGEGLKTLRKECTRCHSLMQISNADGRSRPEWEKHVVDMTDIERRPEAMREVVDYLTEHFPPGY